MQLYFWLNLLSHIWLFEPLCVCFSAICVLIFPWVFHTVNKRIQHPQVQKKISMMKQYFIAWDSFPINLLQYIKEIAYGNVFTDVTLVSDDKVEFRAHQVILACFSEIFRDCVPEHQDTITILLPGIKSNVLQVLIDFIYTGNTTFEVNNMVKVEDLLEAGRCLRIQGIKEANFHQQNSDEQD